MHWKRRMRMAKASGRESITSLNIRVGDPPKPPVSCPVCNCPFGPSEEGVVPVVRCEQCGTKYHEPCFWRELPLEEWVEYLQLAMGTNDGEEEDEDDEEEDDEDDEEDEDGFEIICAACREK